MPQLTTLASWGLLSRRLAALRTRHERLSRAGPNRRLRGSLEARPKSPIRRLLAPRHPLRVQGSDADEGETRQSLLGSDGMDDDCASSDLITPASAPHRGLLGILRLSWAVLGRVQILESIQSSVVVRWGAIRDVLWAPQTLFYREVAAVCPL